MKMQSEHYATLREHVTDYADSYGGLEYLKAEYTKDGLSMKRLRWDLLYGASTTWRAVTGQGLIGDGKGQPGLLPLYAYLNDSHIDTALRTITETN